MSSRRFRVTFERPPLVEAVCEFRFAPESGWDWTVPGRLHERIRDRFPLAREVRPAMRVLLGAGEPEPRPAPERVQFLTSDEKRLVQSGPDLLAVNVLSSYPGWEDFLHMILDIFRVHAELLSSPELARVGLRYINRISLDGVTAGEVTKVMPPLEKLFGVGARAFYERYDMVLTELEGTLVYQTGTVGTPPEAIMIDLDAGWMPGKVVEEQALRSWLDEAHVAVEMSLARSLTEPAAQRLGMRERDA